MAIKERARLFMADKAAADARAKRIEALEYEREGYMARGLKDRVEQVNAAIRALRGEPQGRVTPKRPEAR